MLPQRPPFRLVERRADDAVLVRLAGDAVYLRADPLPLTLAVEILAQAALLLAGAAGAAEPVYLGGIDEARLVLPFAPGDDLRARAAVSGAAGGLTRIATRLERSDGELVAEATLLLVKGARG